MGLKSRTTMYMDLILGIFCSILLLKSTQALTCANGYTSRDADRCYKLDTTSRTQASAKAACAGDGAELVSIKSSSDQTFYLQVVTDASVSNGVWIGAEEEDREFPSWRYLTGRTLSDIRTSEVLDQGCYKYTSSSTDLTDVDTASSFASGQTTRDRCLSYCNTNGYDVAAVNAGNNCLCGRDPLTRRDKPFTSPEDSGGCVTRCAGDSLSKCGGTGYTNILRIGGQRFSQWAYNQPNNYDESNRQTSDYNDYNYQQCAALDTFNGDKLNDLECSKKQYYICEDSAGLYHLYDGQSSDKKTWWEARQNCSEQHSGGDLAVIDDDAAWSSLTLRNDNVFYWIGLASYFWAWPDGTIMSYSNWKTTSSFDSTIVHEPNNQGTSKCAYMKSAGTDRGTWHDDKCADTNSARGYICQISAMETTTAAPTTTTAAPTTTTTTAAPTSSTTTSRTPVPTTPSPNSTPTPTPAPTQRASVTNADTPTTTTQAPVTTPAPGTATPTPAPANTTPAPATPAPGSGTQAPGSGTPAPSTPAPTPAPTGTTTPAAATTGLVAATSAGASTEDNSGLSTLVIILIVLCILLFIIIVVMIILVCYYKRKNARKNRVGLYDGRPVAPIPYSGAIGDEVYLPASEAGSTGSQSNLLKDKNKNENSRSNNYEPSPRPTSVTVDSRY